MSHLVAILFGTHKPPEGKESDYTWVGDAQGGVWVRCVTHLSEREHLCWTSDLEMTEQSALDDGMDKALILNRDGEVLCNCIKAAPHA